MIRYSVLLPILGLAFLAAACGDGGGGAPTPSPSPTAGATPTVQPTETQGELPSPTAAVDETPPPEETPETETTPDTTSGPTPAGTPAVGPGEPEFDISSEIADCVFNADTSVADCGDQGTFTIDPPLIGDYKACDIYVIQDQPVMLICTGGEQVQPAYYVIPQ